MPVMPAVSSFLSWFTQHPLGTAVLLYIIGIFSVLVYSYFETHETT